jgi:hypothetical protein
LICGDGRTAKAIRARDAVRMSVLEQHADVEVFWECEIKRMLKTEPGMQEFFDECFEDGAIRLRDAFFGGRTNVERMFAVSDDEYEIVYVDVQV